MNIREELKAEMERQGKNSSQLARVSNILPTTIYGYFRGAVSTVDTVEIIAAALGMELVVLTVKK